MEIFEDLPNVDAVFVAVGGGGLIGGIAAYLKSVKPSVKVTSIRKVFITHVQCSQKTSTVLFLKPVQLLPVNSNSTPSKTGPQGVS